MKKILWIGLAFACLLSIPKKSKADILPANANDSLRVSCNCLDSVGRQVVCDSAWVYLWRYATSGTHVYVDSGRCTAFGTGTAIGAGKAYLRPGKDSTIVISEPGNTNAGLYDMTVIAWGGTYGGKRLSTPVHQMFIVGAATTTTYLAAADPQATTIASGDFASGAIDAAAIATDAIGAAEIAASAITSSEAPNLDAAVTSRLAPTVAARTLDVSAGGEAGVDWANIGSPTTTQGLSGTTILRSTNVAGLDALAIGPGDFDADAIDATAIATSAIGAAEIATDAITSAEIAADAIGSSEIATDAIGAAEIAASAIGTSEWAAEADNNGIDWADVANPTSTVGLTNTTVGTVTTTTTATNVTTVNGLAANVITAASIANGAIGATEFAADAITAGAIAADAITSSELADDAIDVGAIAAGAIGSSEIAADAIGASQMAANAIGAAEIANAAIDTAALATDFKQIAIREISAGAAPSIAANTIETQDITGVDSIRGSWVYIVSSSTGSGQTRMIASYNTTTNVATITPNWSPTPTGTVNYVIYSGYGGLENALLYPDAERVIQDSAVSGIWRAATATYSATSGSFGHAAINNDNTTGWAQTGAGGGGGCTFGTTYTDTIYFRNTTTSTNIPNAIATITNASGASLGQIQANSNGRYVGTFDAATYLIYPHFLSGITWTDNPDTFVVAGAGQNDTVRGQTFDIGTPSAGNLVRVYDYVRDIGGQGIPGLEVTATLVKKAGVDVVQYPNTDSSNTVIDFSFKSNSRTDTNGCFFIDVLRLQILSDTTLSYTLVISGKDRQGNKFKDERPCTRPPDAATWKWRPTECVP